MKTPADQAARDSIRDDLDVSMLVEAAAGTGKTTSLVARMVRLVETGRASPANIAAVTFTLKAAAHLREKFQQALEKSGRSDAVAEIDRGFIGTTHAFCARLLRERPVEAGLDPEFREVDAAVARQLTTAFWQRWCDAALASNHALFLEARELGLDRRTLLATFERLVEHPDVTIVKQRRERPDLAELCRAVMWHVDEAAQYLPSQIDSQDKYQMFVVKLQRLRDSRDLEEDLDAQLELLNDADHTSTVAPTQKRWPGNGKLVKALHDHYAQFVRDTLRPSLRRWKEYVHGVAMDVLEPAVREFADERRHDGTLTFQDLLTCARDLLREHPQVRRSFQRRFAYVLVDEFQDTDPLQAEVLFYLTGEEVEERNWRKLRPRAGSLFIVGDPKQSIYRFRRADITTYNDVKQRMDVVRTLSANFRSGEAICTFVNESFRTLFTRDDVDAGRQAAHIDLDPFSEEPSLGVFGLESLSGGADAVAEAEAECIARWIRNAVDAGTLRYEDFLLVAWRTMRLHAYARALEAQRIPYAITGSRAFKVAEELRAAMPLLKAIAEPDDPVSLVAFLRGPLCGAGDDALYRFVEAKGRFQVFSELPASADARIARGMQLVREAIEEKREHPPAAVIARLFDRIGLVPLAASGERSGTRAGGLLLALSVAREESSQGQPFEAIVEQLEDFLKNPPDEFEELDADPARHDAVRLMNLHQVKGLEAPVVFLIDPADASAPEPDLFIDRSGEESRGHFVVKTESGRAWRELGVPPEWDANTAVEQAFRAAQERRLLYVAATRARRMLVIGYRRTQKGIQGAWHELASRVKERLGELPPVAAMAAPAIAAAQPFDVARADLAARFDAARRASYDVLPITKLAHESHAQLVRAEEGLGKGTSWGRVLHRLFEALLRDESLDVRAYAENLLKDEERDPVEAGQVVAAVDALRNSPLWTRVRNADERYAEVPFALMATIEGSETLLHGIIDLVFREGGTWYIVDYKSDSLAGGRLDSLVEYYRPQVDHYVRFWSKITNAPARGGLFFVDGAVERWL